MNIATRNPFVLFALAATLTLGGCASWVAPMSDQPHDQYHGSRTLGAKIEDQRIERKTYINIVRTVPGMKDSRLTVVSWNGQVLLAGQVATEDMKPKAESTAAAVRHVLHVHNELQVGKPISLLVRANDGWITTRVKARLLLGPDVPGRRTKVVTENGVVYLMGLLTQEEAEMAVNAARDVYGVQKIVKIVEYIDAKNATR